MFKKKKPFNPYENHADELLYEVWETRDHLTAMAKQAITREGVVAIYPCGPDRARAIQDADAFKDSLLVAIGAYDTARMEYNDYIKKNAEKLNGAKKVWTTTSHEIIERAYEDYYKRG